MRTGDRGRTLAENPGREELADRAAAAVVAAVKKSVSLDLWPELLRWPAGGDADQEAIWARQLLESGAASADDPATADVAVAQRRLWRIWLLPGSTNSTAPSRRRPPAELDSPASEMARGALVAGVGDDPQSAVETGESSSGLFMWLCPSGVHVGHAPPRPATDDSDRDDHTPPSPRPDSDGSGDL